MMKHELEKLVGEEIEESYYDVLETIYMYYPGMETKEQITAVYKIGMLAVTDLFPRAKALKDIEGEISALQAKAKQLRAVN